MKRRGNFRVCMRLIRLVGPLTGRMLLAILLGLLGHLCAASIPVLGGAALLCLMGFQGFLSLRSILICAFVFAAARGALHYGEQTCNHFIAFKLLALIRNKVFAALRRLAPAKLEGRDKGDLIAVITADIELLEVFYAHTISPIAIAFLMSVIMCLWIGSFHWMLSVLSASAYFTIGIMIPLQISKRNGDIGNRIRSLSGELSGFVLESLRGLTETLQYGGGAARLEGISRRTKELSAQEQVMKQHAGFGTAATNTIILLFDLSMLLLSGTLYCKGIISFPGMLLSTLSLMSSFGPVIALSNLGSGLQNTFAAGNRVLDILDETPVTQDVTGKTGCRFTGAEAKEVVFSYGGEQILSGLSAEIPLHAVVGITGKSGSGKSTFLKLLMRFWEAQGGSVSISGRRIADVNTADLRDMESYVTQETHLFHDSIAANLRIAKQDAAQEELEEACRKASVHDFICSLPKGYNTTVGELGSTLSGGERQRLGLARAFLRNAPFMLLDEPTSNLDSLNEAVILRAIRKERGDRTVVLVSHRGSTMRLADIVYSVDHGRNS